MNHPLRLLEFILLFFVLPIGLALPLPITLKLTAVGISILYVIVIFIKKKNFSRMKLREPNIIYVFRVAFLAILLFVAGIFIVKMYQPELLFNPVKQQPLFWLTILFVYTFLSVLPQEIIYRKFFLERYYILFDGRRMLYLFNIICFSICHLFLHNVLVLILTAVGGCFFLYTYEKEKNIWWTSLEHALYGNIIFTLGIGEMLAFPG